MTLNRNVSIIEKKIINLFWERKRPVPTTGRIYSYLLIELFINIVILSYPKCSKIDITGSPKRPEMFKIEQMGKIRNHQMSKKRQNGNFDKPEMLKIDIWGLRKNTNGEMICYISATRYKDYNTDTFGIRYPGWNIANRFV